MKKIILIPICIIISTFLVIKCYDNCYSIGNIDEVVIDVNNSEFNDKAINLIINKFATKEFKGCILKKITSVPNYYYSNTSNGEEVIWNSREDYLKELYDADDIIMLSIEYNSNIFSTLGYTKYLFADIICVLKDDEWQIVSWGLG